MERSPSLGFHASGPFLIFSLPIVAAAFLSCRSAPPPSSLQFSEGDTLRKYADHAGLLIGTVATHGQLFGEGGSAFRELVAREFNLFWPDALWRVTEPSEGVFDFSREEEMDSIAAGRGMVLKSSAGPWHALNPPWLEQKCYTELGPVLERHVAQEMSRRKGDIEIWDVFDEVMNDEGNGFRNRQSANTAEAGFRRSIWVDGNDTSLIKDAFTTARRIDPRALLFLNDFGNEEYEKGAGSFAAQKGKAFYESVVQMRKNGTPIDGVGFQLHEMYPARSGETDVGPEALDACLKNIDRNVKRYAAQGLLVEFSEVTVAIRLSDLDLNTDQGRKELEKRLDHQARVYEGLLRIAPDNRNVVAFIIFGPADKYPNIAAEGYGKPQIFDEELRPKPAYYALLAALKEKAATEPPRDSRLRQRIVISAYSARQGN